MAATSKAMPEENSAKERLIVALDVASADQARSIVDELRSEAGAFKVGLQLFTAAGPAFVRELTSAGHKIFLDLKFHDIPNTVAKASVEAARLGVWMFNLHALGGGEMMRRAADDVAAFCETEGIMRPKMIAVTLLTSSDESTLEEIGVSGDSESLVVRLAGLASLSGLDGVVASAKEAGQIKGLLKEESLIVTPGIRPIGATNDDQRRVITPGAALSMGSTHLVVGRPILEAPDRVAATRAIVSEIKSSMDK